MVQLKYILLADEDDFFNGFNSCMVQLKLLMMSV